MSKLNDKNFVKALLSLYNKKMPTIEIAKQLEIGHSTVYWYLYQLGLERYTKSVKIKFDSEGMAECSKCGKRQPRENFKTRQYSDRVVHQSFCRTCENEENTTRKYKDLTSYYRQKCSNARSKAKKAGLPFDLTIEYLLEMHFKQEGKCFLTGRELCCERNQKNERRSSETCSLDKIVPELGYVKGNVLLVIDKVNRVKADCTLDEMKQWMPEWYRRIMYYLGELND